MNLALIEIEISKVCPCAGVFVDGPTSRIDFLPEATTEQRAAAQAIFDNWVDPPTPDWDGFATWAIANTELNTAAATAQATVPLAAVALPTALLQVQSGNLANFASTFNAVCGAASVSATQRNTWADLARDTYNLPADFVAIVRGD